MSPLPSSVKTFYFGNGTVIGIYNEGVHRKISNFEFEADISSTDTILSN